ncbi:MAG: ParB/RepB/Spo0J family partition protein [Bellilinea sp.]
MSDLYDLDLFDPNPYQPRSVHDPEHIKALAISIAEQGLLQTPVGRLKVEFGIGTRVQLAFGHSRLEAYKFLHETGNSGFDKMPVSLQKLTDEQMFALVITENAQRRDLTVIETARAMKRYRDDFNKTSAEIGELFGLSESAVRNKIRLLNLPADVLAAIETNPVSERVTRELLKLYDLPEEARKTAETLRGGWNDVYRPSNITRLALNGETAEEIGKLIHQLVHTIGVDIADSLFKHDHVFEGEYRSPTCKTCPMRHVTPDDVLCLDKACYKAKQTEAKQLYLAAAAEVCGIPPIEDVTLDVYQVTTWWQEDKERKLASTGCENLRLIYADYGEHGIEGYPKAQICCKKGNGRCVCARAINAGLDLHAQKAEEPAGKSLMQVFAPDHEISVDPEPEPDPTPEPTAAPVMITAEQLRQLDRDARAIKRQNLEECKAMREEMIKTVFLGLSGQNRRIIQWLAGEMAAYQTREKLAEMPVDELWLGIADRLVRRLFDWTYSEPQPERVLKTYNGILEEAGLPLIESVSVETE